jgi:cobalamin biosynthesis Mg chelatase CobN
MCNALYNFKPFFEKIVYNVTRSYLRETCTVIEYCHIFGEVFDDEGVMISLKEELEIFDKVEQELQKRFGMMQIKLIACGLKILGREHIQKQLDAIMEADNDERICAFDMVCEEETNPPLDEYLDLLLAAK